MKLLIRMAILSIVFLAIPAYAETFNNSDLTRYWGKHADAKQAIFDAFRKGAPVAEYGQPFLDLARWETQLVMTGLVRGDDPRLLSGLAKGENFTLSGPYDYPRLAYRIFVHEFARQSGYRPNPVELFDWPKIQVQPH